MREREGGGGDRQTDRDRERDRQTDRETNRDRQTDRQTGSGLGGLFPRGLTRTRGLKS